MNNDTDYSVQNIVNKNLNIWNDPEAQKVLFERWFAVEVFVFDDIMINNNNNNNSNFSWLLS